MVFRWLPVFFISLALSVVACGTDDPAPESKGEDGPDPEAALSVTIQTGPGKHTADTSAEFTFSLDDAAPAPSEVTFQCRLNEAQWEVCASPHSYEDLPEGTHTFSVRATDAARDVNGQPAAYQWEIELTPSENGEGDVEEDPVWISMVTGEYHTCGLKPDGTLWCWGNNEYGQLGNGTAGYHEAKTKPTQEARMDTDWVSAGSGWNHTCGIKGDGTLWCWGDNGDGKLGDGTEEQRLEPTQVGVDTDWVAVDAGGDHTCGIKDDGTLWCWGDNFRGQCGTGSSEEKHDEPTQEAREDTDWESVSAGGRHTCAVKTDGTLWCWGDNFNGPLGDSTTERRYEPRQVSGSASNWMSVSADDSHTCAVRTDGTLWCWGSNSYNRLGDGTDEDRRLVPTQEAGMDSDWAAVGTGWGHSCGVKTDGTLWCWGRNRHGNLGDGTEDNRDTPTQEVGMDTDWASVNAGGDHTCSMKEDGTLWCWGDNHHGQLGDGTTEHRSKPGEVEE